MADLRLGDRSGSISPADHVRWLRAVEGAASRGAGLPDVLRTVVRHAPSALGVLGVLAAGVHDGRLHVTDLAGVGDGVHVRHDIVDLSAPDPLSEAARWRSPLALCIDAELAELYPGLEVRDPAVAMVLAAPLTLGTRTTGALGLACSRPVVLDDPARHLLTPVAQQVAATYGHHDGDSATDDERPPASDRVAALERELMAMKDMLRFIGGIAAQHLTSTGSDTD